MIDINSSRSIAAIVLLAVIGPCVFILQPGFVQGLVDLVGLTPEQAGALAAYEMFGIAATTVLMSAISNRVPWRATVAVALVISVLGNLASVGQQSVETLSIIRFVTGLGSGVVISLTFTMMGLTARADRNFGYIIVWVLTYGALGLLAMPTAYELVGMNGVLVFFAAFCALGLPFVRWLPAGGAAAQAGATKAYAGWLRGTALLAIFAYNVAIGLVWAYLFLVGIEAGMSEQAVANVLTVSQFLGIAGAFVAVVLETRIGRLLPLLVGIVGGAVSVYILVGNIASPAFWIGVCGFNLLWNLSMPYLLGMLAEFDASGRVVVHGVSMQFVGLAVGPYTASRLFAAGGYDQVNLTAVVLFAVALALLLPGVLAQRDS